MIVQISSATNLKAPHSQKNHELCNNTNTTLILQTVPRGELYHSGAFLKVRTNASLDIAKNEVPTLSGIMYHKFIDHDLRQWPTPPWYYETK